jgi:cation:H+ antiporter
MLVFGANWLVEGAETLAHKLGVSDLVIGLTVVALGTSLPEVAASIVASIRKERDIAVGNVVGSNLFNLLAVLGGASAVAPDGMSVDKSAFHFDLPIMTATALACMPVFFSGGRISRGEGLLFFLYYLAYLVFLALQSIDSADRQAAVFGDAMLWFVIPLTGAGLTFSLFYSLHKHAKGENIPANR